MSAVFAGISASGPSGLRIPAVVGLAVLLAGCFEQTEALYGLNAWIDDDASADEQSEAYAIIDRRGGSVDVYLEEPNWWLISGVPSSSCPLLREELAAHPAVLRVTECKKQL